MEDLAVLGIAVESTTTVTADQRLVKLAATSATTEQATKRLTAATTELGSATETATRRRSQYDDAHTKSIRTAAMAADATNAAAAAQRRATADITAGANAISMASKQADGFARLAHQSMVDAGRSRSRELMASVEASTSAIKGMYVGAAAAATTAATTIAAAHAKVAASTASVGYMGRPGQVGLNAQQRVMLGYQLQDVFTSLASGMNPAVVAAQQGPQISMLYGGMGNMLRAIPKPLLIGGGAVAGIGAGLYGLNSMAESQDARRLQDRRFSSMLGGDGSGMMRDIGSMASAASIGIDKATESVEGFAKATRGLGASRQDVLSIAESMEKLAKLGGANDNEAGAAREGVAGMLKQATVNADQLKTVLANAPRIADQIAAGLGVSVTQLRLMADAGDLTNRQVLDAMLKRSTAVNAEFEQMPKSIGDLFSSIGTDLGIALKNLADSIPLVNQYRNAIELAAKAAKSIRESSAGPTAQQTMARTGDIGFGGARGNQTSESFAAQQSGALAGQREFFDAQYRAALEDNARTLADIAAKVRAADESLVAATGIARKLDPLGEAFRGNTRDIEAMERSLGDLQNGLTSLSAQEAAGQMVVLENAIRRAKEEAQNIDPALKAINDINRRNDFRANDNTPAGMAYQQQVQDLMKGGSNEQNAITAALAAQQEKAADLVALKRQEADASTAMLNAVRKGRDATIEAKVEAGVLAFIWANVGKNVELSADMIKDYRDSLRTILKNDAAMTGINASKPLLDDLAAIAEAMKVVEKGAYAMKRAEAEAKAARDENGTGGLQMQVFDARQGLADATTIDTLRQEVELTNKLATAAGNVAEQKRLQLDYDIKRAQQNAAPASAEKIAIEMRAKAAADLRLETANGAAELEKQVEFTRQQADIVRSGNADYAAQIAMLQKKNELLAKGVDLASDEAQRQITGAGNLAKANVELDRAKEAADATKRIWQNAFDGVQAYGADVFFNLFTGVTVDGADVAKSLKNIFLRAFAEIAAAAVIRPIIAPIFGAAAGLGIMPGSASAAAYGGGGGLGGLSMPSIGGGGGAGGLSSWTAPSWLGGGQPFGFLGQPMFGTPASPAGAYAAGAVGSVPIGAANTGISGWANSLTWGQGLGALAGAGMGIYNLASSKSTGQTLGGIASLVGAGVSLIPGVGQIAGPIISILGSVLPGLFESKPEPPTMRATGGLNFSGGRFSASGSEYGGASSVLGTLGGVGQTMQSLLDAAGVRSQSSSNSLNYQTFSKGDFSNATTFVNGKQWGQGSGGDAGLDTAAAHIAHKIMVEVDSGVSDVMREGLSNFGRNNLDHAFSTKELGDAITKLSALDTAMASFGKNTTDAEAAIKAVDEGFNELFNIAAEFKLSASEVSKIEIERDRQRLKATEDFTTGISQGILEITDPLQAQLNALEQMRKKDLANNEAYVRLVPGYQDQAANIEQLYYLKRNKIIDDANAEAVAAQQRAAEAQARAAELAASKIQSLQDVIDRLTYGDLANASPEVAFAGAKATYMATLAQANAGDATAIDRLAGVTEAYARADQSFNASGSDYVSNNLGRISGLRGVQTSIGSGVNSGNNEMVNALLRSNAQQSAMIQDLINDNRESREEIAALVAELRREAA